jgi:hypothetical protein
MTRRRRRVLIVSSVLALLIGGLWWWTRPRIDPRLVGTWYGMNYNSGWGLRFLEDGNGEEFSPFDSANRTPFRWWAKDGVLAMDKIDDEAGLAYLTTKLSVFWECLSTWTLPASNADRYEITGLSLDQDQLHLFGDGKNGAQEYFHRISAEELKQLQQ